MISAAYRRDARSRQLHQGTSLLTAGKPFTWPRFRTMNIYWQTVKKKHYTYPNFTTFYHMSLLY